MIFLVNFPKKLTASNHRNFHSIYTVKQLSNLFFGENDCLDNYETVSNLLLKIEHFYPEDTVSAEEKSFLIIFSFVPFFSRQVAVRQSSTCSTWTQRNWNNLLNWIFSKKNSAPNLKKKKQKILQKLKASRRRELKWLRRTSSVSSGTTTRTIYSKSSDASSPTRASRMSLWRRKAAAYGPTRWAPRWTCLNESDHDWRPRSTPLFSLKTMAIHLIYSPMSPLWFIAIFLINIQIVETNSDDWAINFGLLVSGQPNNEAKWTALFVTSVKMIC